MSSRVALVIAKSIGGACVAFAMLTACTTEAPPTDKAEGASSPAGSGGAGASGGEVGASGGGEVAGGAGGEGAGSTAAGAGDPVGGGGGNGGEAPMLPIESSPQTQSVSAGNVVQSAKYRMVFTLGQPTQNQGIMVSQKYLLNGGLIGANGEP